MPGTLSLYIDALLYISQVERQQTLHWYLIDFSLHCCFTDPFMAWLDFGVDCDLSLRFRVLAV